VTFTSRIPEANVTGKKGEWFSPRGGGTSGAWAVYASGVPEEIRPEPTEAERRALLAALASRAELPPAYASAWRRAAVEEAVGRGRDDWVDFVPDPSN
jgi:hypothetical protein